MAEQWSPVTKSLVFLTHPSTPTSSLCGLYRSIITSSDFLLCSRWTGVIIHLMATASCFVCPSHMLAFLKYAHQSVFCLQEICESLLFVCWCLYRCLPSSSWGPYLWVWQQLSVSHSEVTWGVILAAPVIRACQSFSQPSVHSAKQRNEACYL